MTHKHHFCIIFQVMPHSVESFNGTFHLSNQSRAIWGDVPQWCVAKVGMGKYGKPITRRASFIVYEVKEWGVKLQ